MERALIVRAPHAGLIVDSLKPWEMRSSTTDIRGMVGIIEARSGLIIGEANLVHSISAIDPVMLAVNYRHKHLVEDYNLLEKWNCPWVFKNAKRYDKPIPYKHPQGAVIWVKLEGSHG